MEIIRTFTVPNNNEFAKQNLLELWKDDRFHEVLRQALAPGTPDLLLPTVMVLIFHLTYHEVSLGVGLGLALTLTLLEP